jgi:hypothetical protein
MQHWRSSFWRARNKKNIHDTPTVRFRTHCLVKATHVNFHKPPLKWKACRSLTEVQNQHCHPFRPYLQISFTVTPRTPLPPEPDPAWRSRLPASIKHAPPLCSSASRVCDPASRSRTTTSSYRLSGNSLASLNFTLVAKSDERFPQRTYLDLYPPASGPSSSPTDRDLRAIPSSYQPKSRNGTAKNASSITATAALR